MNFRQTQVKRTSLETLYYWALHYDWYKICTVFLHLMQHSSSLMSMLKTFVTLTWLQIQIDESKKTNRYSCFPFLSFVCLFSSTSFYLYEHMPINYKKKKAWWDKTHVKTTKQYFLLYIPNIYKQKTESKVLSDAKTWHLWTCMNL